MKFHNLMGCRDRKTLSTIASQTKPKSNIANPPLYAVGFKSTMKFCCMVHYQKYLPFVEDNPVRLFNYANI